MKNSKTQTVVFTIEHCASFLAFTFSVIFLLWGSTSVAGETPAAPQVQTSPKVQKRAETKTADSKFGDKKNLETSDNPIRIGVKLISKAAENYPKNRQCFSCHHQTLPVLALTAARQSGREVSDSVLKLQRDFTCQSFHRRLDTLRKHKPIGGESFTVGYGLWMMRLLDVPADEVTTAMVSWLLAKQQADGHWKRYMSRPPSEDSNIMCTVLACQGIRHYATMEQRAAMDNALEKARRWLETVTPESQEDHAALLWAVHILGSPTKESASKNVVNVESHAAPVTSVQSTKKGWNVVELRTRILARQRSDGGWGQLTEMASDAYATGQTAFILHETGLPAGDPGMVRARDYLLQTQQKDGSWFVKTRSKPVQVFFDNGDPHGENQFISIAASSWAVAALVKLEPIRITPK